MAEVIRRGREVHVLTDEGEYLPVTRMYDEDGDECDDFDAAVRVTAGPDADGLWVQVRLFPETTSPLH